MADITIVDDIYSDEPMTDERAAMIMYWYKRVMDVTNVEVQRDKTDEDNRKP